MSEDRAPAVGYKRPPQHSRFKPGRSGNPAGRPKGTKNIETDLKEELSERIAIREGERNLKVSKQRALLKAMMAKALKGDTRAAGIVLQLVTKVTLAEESTDDRAIEPLTEPEAAILERFISRHAANLNKSASRASAPKKDEGHE